MSTSSKSGIKRAILVTGATGMQGGAVVRALVEAGASVSGLVRDPNSPASVDLRDLGVDLRVGDLDDPASLQAACVGQDAVFSVQLASNAADPQSEQRQARNLLRAAEVAEVRQFVHSSVSGTGWRETHPSENAGGTEAYWDSKEEVESSVRSAQFDQWTLLKPAFFMENFIKPKVGHMFPRLSQGEIVVASQPSTALAMVSGDDFGRAAAAVFSAPERYSTAEIELASDVLSFEQIARVFTETTGVQTETVSCSPTEVEARLGSRSWTGMQLWLDAVGYPARPEHSAALGIHMTDSFGKWLAKHS